MKQLGLAFLQYTQDYDERLPNTIDGTPGATATAFSGWISYTAFPANATPGSYQVSQGSLYSYVKSAQVYICPSDGQGRAAGNSYAANECLFASSSPKTGKNISVFSETSKWMLLGEEAATSTDPVSSTDDAYLTLGNNLTARHLEGTNIAFLDGHVKWFRTAKVRADNYGTGGVVNNDTDSDGISNSCPT